MKGVTKIVTGDNIYRLTIFLLVVAIKIESYAALLAVTFKCFLFYLLQVYGANIIHNNVFVVFR